MSGGSRPPAGVPEQWPSAAAAVPPPFLSKTFDLVSDAALDAVVSWTAAGNSFVVWDPCRFSRDVLPHHFKHSNFSSFVRQLNTYGFRKVHADRWEFANEDFLRGSKHLLKNIYRRRSQQSPTSPVALGSSSSIHSLSPDVIEGELDALRSQRNVLEQEVIILGKEQTVMTQQVSSLHLKLQRAEERQKQMMSFMAKVLRNPALLPGFQLQGRGIGPARPKKKFLMQYGDAGCLGSQPSADQLGLSTSFASAIQLDGQTLYPDILQDMSAECVQFIGEADCPTETIRGAMYANSPSPVGHLGIKNITEEEEWLALASQESEIEFGCPDDAWGCLAEESHVVDEADVLWDHIGSPYRNNKSKSDN